MVKTVISQIVPVRKAVKLDLTKNALRPRGGFGMGFSGDFSFLARSKDIRGF